jgi:hypothetical protein
VVEMANEEIGFVCGNAKFNIPKEYTDLFGSVKVAKKPNINISSGTLVLSLDMWKKIAENPAAYRSTTAANDVVVVVTAKTATRT